jgi:cysteine-rich repeat protein
MKARMPSPRMSVWLLWTLACLAMAASESRAQYCGNALCETDEEALCPEDCGYCGDLKCDPCMENSQSCAVDCYCGDFYCDATEAFESCPEDCMGSVCGDLVCDFDEDCVLDCVLESGPQCSGGPYCGDGLLDEGEACDDGNGEDGDCCSSLCEFEADLGSCDDDDVCNGQESCAVTGCVPGTAMVCDDQDDCTSDSCDPESGCLYLELQDCVPDPSGAPVDNDNDDGDGDEDSGVGGEGPPPANGTLGGGGCSLIFRP